MKKKYPLIELPPSSYFERLKKKEIEAFFSDFIKIMPTRIAYLKSEIYGLNANFPEKTNPESLFILEAWLLQHLKLRKISEDEKEDYLSQLSPEFRNTAKAPSTVLDPESRAMAFDAGLYFGEVIIANNSGSFWEPLTKGSRRNVLFGHPCIHGFTPSPICPIINLTTLCSSLAEGLKSSGSIPALYAFFSDTAQKFRTNRN